MLFKKKKKVEVVSASRVSLNLTAEIALLPHSHLDGIAALKSHFQD